MKKIIFALLLSGCGAPTFQYNQIKKHTYSMICASHWRCIDTAEKLCNAVGYDISYKGMVGDYTTLTVRCKFRK